MVSQAPATLVTRLLLPGCLHDVWPYFREPELIAQWHGWEYDDLDAEIAEIYGNAAIGEDHRTINVGTHFFNLCEHDGGTRLEVYRVPHPGGDESDLPNIDLPHIDEGWISFVQQLRFMLDRHPAGPRHTVFVGGLPKDPTISPVQMVGLGQVGLQQNGALYGATVGPGDALTGTVWFESANQIGVTVDGWGDGLLIVANGPAGGPPYVSGQAVLSTYGLDHETRADLRDRWTQWWARHYS